MPSLQKRNGHGHFIKASQLSKVEVYNPLKRITKLLKQIERQKAFSFKLRSSLGIFLIAMVLAFVGAYGGSKILCSRSIQTHVGFLKILNYQQSGHLSFLERIPYLSNYVSLPKTPTIILIDNQSHVIHLISENGVNLLSFANLHVFATGRYNSCSQTLKIFSPSGIERAQ